jgi:hypothetical protein
MSGSSSIVAKGTEGHRKPLLKQLWTAVVASGVAVNAKAYLMLGWDVVETDDSAARMP